MSVCAVDGLLASAHQYVAKATSGEQAREEEEYAKQQLRRRLATGLFELFQPQSRLFFIISSLQAHFPSGNCQVPSLSIPVLFFFFFFFFLNETDKWKMKGTTLSALADVVDCFFFCLFISSVRIFVSSWNIGGVEPPEDMDMGDWLSIRKNPADIYVFGYLSNNLSCRRKKTTILGRS